MALNPNIPLSGQQMNPLGAIFEAEGIKGRETQRRAAEMEMDAAAKEGEIKSMLDTSVRLNEYLKNDNIPGAINFTKSNIAAIESRGGDSSNSRAVLQALEAGEIDAVKSDVGSAINFGYQTGRLTAPTSGGESQIGKLNPDLYTPESVMAFQQTGDRSVLERRIDGQVVNIGGVPHVYDQNRNTIKPITIGDKEVTTESVAESEGAIAENVEFNKLTGKQRAEGIDTAVQEIMKSEVNIDNLEEAKQALLDGAQSGPIVSKWTPTIREETQRLNQVKNKLGLDVVGAVTFGALSKGELDIALATALPDLPPPELIKWIEDRQNAQRKLIAYYDEQIEFLDNGGTIAGFRKSKMAERRKEREAAGDNEINSLVDKYAD